MKNIVKSLSFIVYPIIFSLIFLGIPIPSFAQQQERVTITTYYPSPSGNFNELHIKRATIGDTYMAKVWGSGAANIALDADLVVEENVGIGTFRPEAKLDVNGWVQIGGGHDLILRAAWNNGLDPGDLVFRNSANAEYARVYSGVNQLHLSAGTSTNPEITINDNGNASMYGRLLIHGAGVGDDTGYGGNLVVTNPSSQGSYINLIRAGNKVWTLGYVPNSNSFTIGNGNLAGLGAFTIADNGNVSIGGIYNPADKLDVDGSLRVRQGITVQRDIDLRGSLNWGTAGVLQRDQGASMELGGSGIPYIDFKNNPHDDFDARVILWGDNQLNFEGANIDFISFFNANNRTRIMHDPNAGSTLITDNVIANLVVANHVIPIALGALTGAMLMAAGFSSFYAAAIIAIIAPLLSDARLKKDIMPLQNILGKIMQLRAVSYKWNDEAAKLYPQISQEKQIGMIAQEVEKIFPEFVTVGPGGYKTIDYSRFTAVLLEGMKEQQVQINNLEAKIEALKKVKE